LSAIAADYPTRLVPVVVLLDAHVGAVHELERVTIRASQESPSTNGGSLLATVS
jgi:hypothetical protein